MVRTDLGREVEVVQSKLKLEVAEGRRASWQEQGLEMVALAVMTVIIKGAVEILFVPMGVPKEVVVVQKLTGSVARMRSGQLVLQARLRMCHWCEVEEVFLEPKEAGVRLKVAEVQLLEEQGLQWKEILVSLVREEEGEVVQSKEALVRLMKAVEVGWELSGRKLVVKVGQVTKAFDLIEVAQVASCLLEVVASLLIRVFPVMKKPRMVLVSSCL